MSNFSTWVLVFFLEGLAMAVSCGAMIFTRKNHCEHTKTICFNLFLCSAVALTLSLIIYVAFSFLGVSTWTITSVLVVMIVVILIALLIAALRRYFYEEGMLYSSG